MYNKVSQCFKTTGSDHSVYLFIYYVISVLNSLYQTLLQQYYQTLLSEVQLDIVTAVLLYIVTAVLLNIVYCNYTLDNDVTMINIYTGSPNTHGNLVTTFTLLNIVIEFDAILGDLRPSDIRFIRSMVQPIYNFYISVEPQVQ